MKNKLIYICLILSYFTKNSSFGQTGKSDGVVSYVQINNKYEHNAKLYFTTNKSFYVYNAAGIESKKKINFNSSSEPNFDTIPDEFGEITFIDFSKKQLLAREKVVGKSFIYEESLPILKWKLSKETKKIGKFNCQRATTTFRGRNYVVWFTPEIPISIGPWKLNGLPGLILEAYDDTLQIQFSFSGISMPENIEKKMIFPIKEGRKITFEEHKTIVESTFQKAIATADIPKGTTVKFDIDKSVFFELSYEK